MCGIVGVYAYNSKKEVDERTISDMRDSIAHRGPDGVGTYLSPRCDIGLGHRRLSIIDLSTAANQPMSTADNSLWLVFNGEIYNHAEIRAELEQIADFHWKTSHSDTEMILHAFRQWGIDCLQRFRGQFAMALWDERERVLWLIRDRVGLKPLYYTIADGQLAFASEIKALLRRPGQKRAVNVEALYHYLSFLTTPAPDTLFEGIHKLPAGCWLRIDAEGIVRQERYWDVLDNLVSLDGLSEADIADMVLEELREAVKLRKVSDVPVGVFLSGGIDSSTNTALFSEGEGAPVKTFSIGYDGDYDSYQNELHYAKLMAESVGADYYERRLTIDDLIEFLPRMVQLQDEPIADPVCVPVYYVSKLARDNGVTVAQVGEGADELFWGYPHWKLMLRLQQADNLPVPSVFKQLGLGALSAMGRSEASYYEWLRRGVNDQPVFWGGAEAFTEVHKMRLLSSEMRQRFARVTSWQALEPIHQRYQSKAPHPSILGWMTYLDLNLRLPELLLMRVDKMAMGVSLEGRVPFLDHKLVELAMSIPDEVKTRNGELKHLLKHSVRGLIPDELIDRKKQGFGVPVYEWFFDRLGEQSRRELTDFCSRTNYFDREAVLKLFDNKEGPRIWYLLNFAMWHKEYIDA